MDLVDFSQVSYVMHAGKIEANNGLERCTSAWASTYTKSVGDHEEEWQ